MPTFVTTTGIHKSGNSWLGALVARLVNQMPGSNERFLRLFCLHDLVAAIRSCPESTSGFTNPNTARPSLLPENWAIRLLNPSKQNRIDRRALSDHSLDHLARRIRWNMARANGIEFLSFKHIRSELDKMCFDTEYELPDRNLCFLPSKHIPLKTLGSQFGQFKQIWLVRDPRDSLVSYFFHDMGVLTEDKLNWFVKVNPTNGKLKKQKDWRTSFIGDRISRQVEFYQKSIGFSCDRTMLIRYEDLLNSTASKLTHICEFLGMDVSRAKIDEVAASLQFSKITGSNREQPNSFVRKGVAGEWKNYLVQNDARLFSDAYCEILNGLGYEPAGQAAENESNSEWISRLPTGSKSTFDLSRFRLRSSAVYNAMNLWIESSELQAKFPRPFDFEGEHSFFEYLRKCDQPQINDWFRRVAAVFDLNRQLDKRHDADQLLGY